jgi:hypothetical protein
MQKVLGAAGVPQDVIAMNPSVVDTCRECRAWQKAGLEPSPSVELATQQNDYVEADLMFYKQYLVWHMIDRADRWHAAKEISNKQTATLCEAIDTTWVTILLERSWHFSSTRSPWTARSNLSSSLLLQTPKIIKINV